MMATIAMLRALNRHKPKAAPVPRTTLAKRLARKQQLLKRLQEDHPGQHERDEIERQLEEIDTALNLLDKAGPGKSSDEQEVRSQHSAGLVGNKADNVVGMPKRRR